MIRAFTAASIACLSVAVLFACSGIGCSKSDAVAPPAPTVDASAGGYAPPEETPPLDKPLKLAPNSVSDIGFTVAETPIVVWTKTAADAASDAGTAETIFGTIGPGPIGIPVKSIIFSPSASLTASDTLNAVISVYKRTNYDGGAGTTQTLLGTASTFTPGKDGGTGNWTAWTNVNFTMVTANAPFVSPGDVITMAIVKNSYGVTVPAGTLSLFTGP
jgi:hypothetical protein